MTTPSLRDLIDAIEEGYEFFLGYAAQGRTDEGPEIRAYLDRADTALGALATRWRATVPGGPETGREAAHAMIDVLDRDAAAARAALRLVRVQPTITSALVDNLNASIHVRAVLTDLFLLDEALPDGRGAE